MNGRDRPTGKRFQLGLVLSLTLAHFLHDIFTALIAPLLPLLIERLSLTLFLAGTLSVLPQIPPLINPLVGSWVDRGRFARPLVIAAPFVSCTAICLIGQAPSYAPVALLLLIAGLAVAAIHLAGPVIMAEVSGGRVGRGMGFFMFGGEAARTAGPPFAVLVVATLGLEGMWKLIPLGMAASLFLWWRLGSIAPEPRVTPPLRLLPLWKETRRTIGAVSGIILARSFMAAAVTTFLPTFRYSEGSTLLWASAALFVVEAGGALGVLASGSLSDWVGRRKVLLAALFLSPPLMLLFLVTSGWANWVTLFFLGVATISTTPVLWAIMLETSTSNRAAASGTFTMLSFTARSLVVLLVGVLGDEIGLRSAYYVCAALATLGIPFALMLPAKNQGGGSA